MKEIIYKDLYQQRFLLAGGGLLLFLMVFIPASVDLLLLMILLGLIPFLTILLGILINESGEEKNYGYTFLSTLPMSRTGVLGSKFIALLGESVLFTALSLFVLGILGVADIVPVSLSVILAIELSFFISVSAVMYSGIYILGLKNFTRVMLVLMIAVQGLVFMFGLQQYNGVDGSKKILELIAVILNLHPLIILGSGILLWGLLLAFTSQFRKRI